jgi:tetratricopeptide (TPR) repeat protein
MSKVALRVYNREIETLIDQGHIEEAIAHCQHVLKLYPKHLETYRLLGKAYLEAHRHTDAADIFQRVLMVVPDDFVSQLGMSLVCDEQKNLDGAIWHMERAFEVNPSNGAVQGELRRLYGRRDGLEPPKIRLTRGALAYMYTKGGQYQQAIVEIKSVLAEDATRVDMKVLMARAFYRAGQKVEATEICIDLLKEFQFCLDANRILVEVLPGTSLSQSVDTYKKRVQALDPYAAQVTGSIFDIDSVPDNSVTVDRLDWDPSSASGDSFAASAQPAAPIPDFLQTSGWGPSTGEFQEGHVNYDDEEPAAAAPAAGLAAAEIPDWLKAMAPPGSSATQAEEPPATDQNLQPEDLDWLSSLGGPLSAGSQPTQQAAPAA